MPTKQIKATIQVKGKKGELCGPKCRYLLGCYCYLSGPKYTTGPDPVSLACSYYKYGGLAGYKRTPRCMKEAKEGK